ncbi:hypothetical protein CMI47_19215 [Candidatus Pacearchaeota archaeon]|nr:hypothetical protein [Candidatus Pacearchaeota archaeon]|tara:strand:+ start:12003 stop:12227 length:225 start_codon:yes stop_codon:yes gene_type:complete
MTKQSKSFYDVHGNIINVGDLVRYTWDKNIIGMVTGLTPFFDQGSIDVICDHRLALTCIICDSSRSTVAIEVVR